jgi:phosphotriesterase-related protein
MITTVLGRVDAGSLGTVLAAETLLCAPPAGRGNAGRPASEAHFERVPVTMDRLGRLMMGAANRDDRTIDGAETEAALDALAAAVREPGDGDGPHAGAAGSDGSGSGGAAPSGAASGVAGSGTGTRFGAPPAVVALAGRGSSADPALLAALSRASGVAIVRGVDGSAGQGRADGPADPETLAARIAEALRATEHPAGAVGALPLPGGPGAGPGVDRADAARIEAAAVAAHDAGVALVLAPRSDPWSIAPTGPSDADALRRALAAVDAAGLDRSRVVLAGAAAYVANRDDAGEPGVGIDRARLAMLLEHGTALCFDDLGRIPNVRTVVSDHDVAVAILRCAEHGAGDRILLSSGIRNKHRLTAFGGNGLEFVPQQFLPYLRMLGADDDLVRAVGGANAAGVLAHATTGEAEV